MARRITLLIRDDGTSVIESDVPTTDIGTAGPSIPPGKSCVERLKEEFIKAIKAGKRKEAFEALGFDKCSDVPAELIPQTLDKLEALNAT